MRRFMSKVVAGMILVVCAWSGRAGAAVLRVDPNDPNAFGTIGEAVTAAGSGDTIVVAAGVYRGTGNRDVSLTGKAVLLQSESGPERCTVDCEGQGVGFSLDSGQSVLTLDGFTITGGQGFIGGAIRAPNGGMLTLLNCVLTENHATDPGGAVHARVARAVFSHCIFRNNTTTADGGALYADVGSELLLEDCVFVGNQAGVDGGGLHVAVAGGDIRRCAFYGNHAAHEGGATYYGSGWLRLSNTVFSGNSARGEGGAVYLEGWGSVLHCTFSRNTSDALGGAWASHKAKQPVDVYGSVFWGNRDQAGEGASAQIYRTRLEALYSCIQNWPTIPTVSSQDPQFADANGPDGLVSTADDDLSLRPGSPCIDAGLFTSAPWPFELDCRRRPRLAGKAIDLGAYEFHAHPRPPEPVDIWQADPVVVSEVMAHSPGTRDWVELHNTTDRIIDITGWEIYDQQRNVFTFGPNTRIEPQDYLVVYQGTHLPFGFEARGDFITLSATVQGVFLGYRRAHALPGVLTDMALVRHVNSVGLVEMAPSVAPTPGAANAPIAASPVVITEIMYAPPDGNMAGQYVEIANATDAPVALSWSSDPSVRPSWRLAGDVFYEIAPRIPVVLPPGGRLLFARDPNALARMYSDIPAEVDIVGPWTAARRLPDHAGDVSLYAPNKPDNRWVMADSVTYNVGHPVLRDDWSLYWSPTANGKGDSLHRRSLTAYGNDPNNWQGGPPTPGY